MHFSNALFELIGHLDVSEDLNPKAQHERPWMQLHTLYFQHRYQVRVPCLSSPLHTRAKGHQLTLIISLDPYAFTFQCEVNLDSLGLLRPIRDLIMQ
jgi:hypothetical protein